MVKHTNKYRPCFIFIILLLLSTTLNAQVPALKWVVPGVGGYSMTYDGINDIYVAGHHIAKLDSTGNIIWKFDFEKKNNVIARSINLDNYHNVYATGSFANTLDFDPSEKKYNLTAQGWDVFVTKHKADGTFQWARNLGGELDDYGYSLSISLKGTLASTGAVTYKGDFDPGPQNWILPIHRSRLDLDIIADNQFWTSPHFSFLHQNDCFNPITTEAYISLLNVDGNLSWGGACIYGGEENRGRSVIFDFDGNLIATGYYKGYATLSAGDYSLPLPRSDKKNGLYITKWGNEGRTPVWTRCFPNVGGNVEISDQRIKIDYDGNIYFTGSFSDTVDFDPGTGTHLLISKGDVDAFVMKLNNKGELMWVRQIGGASVDKAYNIDFDMFWGIAVTGTFSGEVDFNPNSGSYFMTSRNQTDNFVLKLDKFGNFCWAFQLAIPPQELSVKSDTSNVYITGYFDQPTDFDPGENSYILHPAESKTFFVMRLANINPEFECPIDIVLSNSSISESSPVGTEVGSINSVGYLGPFEHSLVSGAGDTDNNKFMIVDNRLRIKTKLDYETGSSHSVRIQSISPSGCAISKAFIISVLNSNEFQFSAPSDLVLDCVNSVPQAFADLTSFIGSGGQVSSNCAINSQSFKLLNETVQESFQSRKIIRTYEIADVCGNISHDDQIIIISDKIPPYLSQGTTFYLCISEMNYILGPWGWAPPFSFIPKELTHEQLNSIGLDASDNCSVKSITYNDELLSICPFNMLRTFTVTDYFGNSSEAYEEYITDPGLIMAQDDEVLWGGCSLNDIGNHTLLPYTSVQSAISREQLRSEGVNYYTGNGMCYDEELKEIAYWDSLFDTSSGKEIHRTFSLTDYCNNTAQITQAIIFGDNENPVISCPPAGEVPSPDKIPQPYRTVSAFVSDGGRIEDNNGINPESFTIIGEYMDTIQGKRELKRTYYVEDLCGNASICLHRIIINSLTSVAEIDYPSGLNYTIMPNPTKGRFSILFNAAYSDDLIIELVTATGQIIEQRMISSPSSRHVEDFDISDFSLGTYFLVIKSGNIRISEKILHINR